MSVVMRRRRDDCDANCVSSLIRVGETAAAMMVLAAFRPVA
jgi:hypothetical protein